MNDKSIADAKREANNDPSKSPIPDTPAHPGLAAPEVLTPEEQDALGTADVTRPQGIQPVPADNPPPVPPVPDQPHGPVLTKAQKAKEDKAMAEYREGKTKNKHVIFRSRGEENVSFKLDNVRPVRNLDYPGLYEWHVPSDRADIVEKHHHVKNGRIKRVKD